MRCALNFALRVHLDSAAPIGMLVSTGAGDQERAGVRWVESKGAVELVQSGNH